MGGRPAMPRHPSLASQICLFKKCAPRILSEDSRNPCKPPKHHPPKEGSAGLTFPSES